MEIEGVEITLREAIFSVTIASVLFFVGVQLSGCIEHCVNQSNLEYRQAAQIRNSTNEFERAMATDIGNAFVEGGFKAVDTVSHDMIKGKWLWIMADYQEKRRHKRTVHYTVRDSNGHTHTKTRTEYYWSWDTYKVERLHSKKVEYVGSIFPYSKFDYSWISRHYETVDNGFRKRVEFACLPTRFNASIYARLGNRTVPDGTLLHQNVSIDDLYKRYTDSVMVPLFWVLWGGVIVFAVVMFVIAENRWIED